MRPPRSDQGATVAPASTSTASTQEFAVTGPWSDGAAIDARYSCDGANVSPPLSWTAGPAGTVSYALVIDDLDDPDAVLWVVANIDASTLSIAEGTVPPGAVVASGSGDTATYTGPCPTFGSSHEYVVTVFAVSQMLEAQDGDDSPTVRAAIETAAIAEASTTFVYTR